MKNRHLLALLACASLCVLAPAASRAQDAGFFAQQTYTASGSTAAFAVPLPYLNQSDIQVYLNGTLQSPSAFTFTAPSVITMGVTPPAGTLVQIRRATNVAAPAAVFNGGTLSSTDLNANANQATYGLQEAADAALRNNPRNVPVVITLPTGTFNKGLDITQTGPTTTIAGPLDYNHITVNHTANVTGANGSQLTGGFVVDLNVGGSTLGGQPMAAGIFTATDVSGGMTNVADKIGAILRASANVTDASGSGWYGGNSVASVATGATVNRLVGFESDTIINTTGTAHYRYAYAAVNEGNLAADTADTAFWIANIGATAGAFKNLFYLSNSYGAIPMAATADLFHFDSALTIANVFNAPSLTVTGNILGFPNATLTGGGNMALSGQYLTNGGGTNLTTGQGQLFGSPNGGAVLQGFGAVFDVELNNSAGLNVCAVPTGTRQLNCNNFLASQGMLTGGVATSPTAGQGSFGSTPAGGAIVQGSGSSFDFNLNNHLGQNVCANATGTRVLSCFGLETTTNVQLDGATSGALQVKAAAVAGTSTLTLPAGTTDFSATGGTHQVVQQVSAGAALTVGQLATTDLSDTVAPATWTPADASGAALTFTSVTALSTRIGQIMEAQLRLTFPSTVSGSVATIGGLTRSSNSGGASFPAGSCWTNAGGGNSILVPTMAANATQFTLNNAAGAQTTNANLSTVIVTCDLHYVTN